MRIDELTLGEIKELKGIFTKENIGQVKKHNHGCCIVVLDKGFMYVGDLETDGEFLTIKNPKNIRRYTSGKGLLWHAENGPTDMILDSYKNGTIMAPYGELKHFIPVKRSLFYDC